MSTRPVLEVSHMVVGIFEFPHDHINEIEGTSSVHMYVEIGENRDDFGRPAAASAE